MANTVSQVESTLSSGLAESIKNLPGVSQQQKTSLIEGATSLSSSYAPQIVSQVNQTANGSIISLNNNAIGPNQPFNLVGGNLTTTDVTNTLSPVVTDPLNSTLTSGFVNDLADVFKNNQSTTQNQNINFTELTNNLTNIVSPLMNTGLGTALSGFATQLFGGGNSVSPLVGSVSNLFSGGVDQALAKIDQAMSSVVASKALTEAKQFDINTPENQQKLQATRVGFTDPTATYPTKDYANIPETNKLATGSIKGTVVQEKEKDRMLGAQLPNGHSWDQPQSPFKGVYPYNKVFQTESGHIIEMDDSPGSERLHIYHASGTFIEIDANGSIVKRTKGSSYEIIDKNNYVAINGKTNVSINGACNIFVGADANIQVDGDTNILCGNDITAQAGGRIDLSAVEEINIRSANVRIEADDQMHIIADNKLDLQTEIWNIVGNVISQYAVTHNITLDDRFNLNAGGSVDVDGSEIQLNSGTSEAVDVESPENASIGLIDGRTDITEVIINDPIATNYMDNYNVVAEDSNDPALAKNNQEQMVRDGIATRDEVSESVVAGDTSSPQSTVRDVVMPSDALLSVTELPGNYQLSKHFTLAMLTTDAVVTKHKLQPQSGLSYGQLAYNLQALALNVLEPVKALYPNMQVNSCFRAPGTNPTSQHPKGQAVDIQIPNASKADYFDIATKIAKVIKYDQLLLEYKTTGTGKPWIHISLNVSNNRLQAMTFLNDKKYGDGFTQLA